MTIQQCKYVLKIAETGSFSEAAKQLFIAQSSLSSSVKQLEFELGIRLFDRSKSGVFLTAEGAEFVRYAKEISEQNDFIMERYTSQRAKKRLYVSTQHYDFVADVFCRLIRETDEDYDFSLREIHTYDVIGEVECAHSDIGILAIKNNDFDLMSRYLDKRGLVFTELIKVSPHVFVRSEHPLAKHGSLTTDALKEFPYVSYEQGAHGTSLFTEELNDGIEARRRIEISDRATLMNALLTTDCYTVGTGIMPSALNDGKIVCIPLVSDTFYRIGYVLRADRQLSETANRLIELLRSFSDEVPKQN